MYKRYKPIIEEGVIQPLKKMPQVLTSLASDVIGPSTLADFLQNGLPAAMSKNAPSGIMTFYGIWQEVIQGVRTFALLFNCNHLLIICHIFIIRSAQ